MQVAQDDRFELLLADVRSATPEVRVAGLADGRYRIRLRAVDAQGLEGRDAQAVLVLKARPEPPVQQAPAPRAELRGQRVEFAWTAGDGARRYRLQVARTDASADDPFTQALHDVRDIDATTLGLDGLPPGAYAWRVASLRAHGDQGPFGDAQAFSLRPLPPAVAPPGPPTIDDHALRFFWQGRPGQQFDFQLAADSAFAALLEDRRLDSAEVELPRPAAAGRYHVRLRSRDADGFVGPWSATQHVDIVACVRDGSGGCVRVQGGSLQLQ